MRNHRRPATSISNWIGPHPGYHSADMALDPLNSRRYLAWCDNCDAKCEGTRNECGEWCQNHEETGEG